MEKPRVTFSARARADLDGLFDYITAQSGWQRGARVSARIAATLATLAHSPQIGRKRRELSDGDLFFFSVPPWIVAYKPRRDCSGIRVIRVIDSRRDLTEVKWE